MPKLAKLEDYKAPWEVDKDGKDIPVDDQELDPERLKKYLHGLLADKERAQEAKAQVDTQLTEVTGERDTLQTKLNDIERKGESEADRLKRENEELRQKVEKGSDKPSTETLKLRVALRKGLTEIQAKRLVGDTEEALEADADDLLQSFGHDGSTEGGEGDGEGGEPTPRRQPRKLRSPGDPKPDEGPERSVDEILEHELPRSVGF